MTDNSEITKPLFRENYAILKEIADKLRNQQEPDIDSLVPMVDKALKAYANCSARLNEVDKMLKERLGGIKEEDLRF
ncbi:MAG TPA: hypothetical protein VFF74_00170 [Methylophilaceae bacterium]|nr:hypothetical protein [Methylophilaceae bacterium]